MIYTVLLRFVVSALLWIVVHTLEPCQTDEDCVVNGLCLPTVSDKAKNLTSRSCFCPKSCISSVPVECTRHKQCVVDALVDTHDNRCDKEKRLCLCKAPEDRRHACLKENLRIVLLNASRTHVYLGEPFAVTCCVNMEPRSVQLRWYHNGTEVPSHLQPDDFQLCWKLNISAARFRDSGQYTCSAQTDRHRRPVSADVGVQVRGSRFFAFVKNAAADDLRINSNYTDQERLTLKPARLNGTSILLNWSTTTPSSGIKLRVETLEGGTVAYEAVLSDSRRPQVVSGLQPGRQYSVMAETLARDGAPIAYAKVTVTDDSGMVPMEPRDLSMHVEDEIARTKCRVTWRSPVAVNPPVLYYAVDLFGSVRRVSAHSSRVLPAKHRPKSSNCQNLNKVLPSSGSDELTSCDFEGLLPNHNYSARVVAVNAVGRGLPSFADSQCMTSYGPPVNIETPTAKKGFDDKTIDVQFPAAPDSTYGPITCYFLAIVPCTLNVNFSQLPPPGYMNFEVYERAMQSNLHVMFQPIFAYIAEAYFELPRGTVIGDGQQVISTDSKVLDFLGRFLPQDGELERGYKYIGFLIARVDPDKAVYNLSTSRPELLPSWLQPIYSFSGYFEPVFLGDSELTITEHNKKTYHETMYLIAVGFSVILVVMIFSGIGCFYYSHIKGWLKTILCVDSNFVPDRNSFSDLQRVNKCRDFQPTRVEDLPAEYLLRHRDSNFLFTVEFESLPHYSFDTLASDLPVNACKNRYNDIKAFDITRVRLNSVAAAAVVDQPAQSPESANGNANKPTSDGEAAEEEIEEVEEEEEEEEPLGDYINANYIQGYKGNKLFIAAQGPTFDTVNDFWRLIWEKNVRVVIMVTNLQEKYRTMCIKYWPEHTPISYGKIEVKLVDCSFFSDYVIRVFNIHCQSSGCKEKENEQDALLNSHPTDCRQVTQYHYTGWYDYRAPEGSFGFLRFMKEFRQLNLPRDIPILVHCSAGVGRTGTFIAVDGLMDQMAEEDRVDVFGYVSNLRRQRNFMVQSLDQYVFIYKALAEWHMFGDTDVEAERMEQHVHELRRAADGDPTAMTKMEKEFNKLLLTLEDQPNSDFAHKEFNEPKNRYKTVVPYDRNRVVLAPLFGHDDASYINASMIRGYLCRYIITQDPMVNTVWDFWRMVIEQNVCCIVCLTDEASLEAGEKYWPAELNHGVSFGDKPVLTIQKVHEEQLPSYTFRKLHVTSTKENELRKVAMFSFRHWSVDTTANRPSLPNSTASLIDLVGKVSQRQLQSPNAGPVLVHCRDGSKRSGLYCAVSLLLERLRREGKVDVFKTVKALQFQRAYVISSLAQYDFCYQCILDYLQSFG